LFAAMKRDAEKYRAWQQRSAAKAQEKARNKPRKALPKMGKRGKAWAKARAEKNDEFKAAGITACEVRLPGCWHTNGLTHAHTLKRRNVTDLKRTVLACLNCHRIVEDMGEKKMEAILETIIAARPKK
jgi:hypothetical protein